MASIRNTLITRLLIGLGWLFLLFGLILDYLVVNKFEREFDQVTVAKARSLVTLTRYTDEGLEFDFAEEFMPEFGQTGNDAWYFQVWRHDKTLLEKADSLGEIDLALPNVVVNRDINQNVILPNGLSGRQVAVSFVAQIEDEFYEAPIFKEIEKDYLTVPVFLVVARSRAELDATITRVHLVLFTAGLLATLLSLTIVNKSVVSGLTPLLDLQQQMESFEVNTLSNRLALKQSVSELDGTVSNFNNMLDRLQQGFQRERQFSGDVAHELRTPVAEIKSMAQVAIKWPHDEDVKKRFDQDVLAAATQMEDTINTLLALARNESGVTEDDIESIDLAKIVDKALFKYARQSTDRSITVQQNGNTPCTIETVFPYVNLIVENLISNAVNYGNTHTQVTVEQSKSSDQFILTVINQTDKLTLEDITKMFDRLWRKDGARTDGSHSGLGLALVASYCQALGYSIKTDLHRETFTLIVTGPLKAV